MSEIHEDPKLTRARLVRVGAGAAASLTVLNAPLLRSARAAPSAVVVRRSLASLGSGHPIVTGYATAWAAMKALPTTDVHSWAYQAAIHGTELAGSHVAWKTCEHGTHFFWSWHRMYLYYFERIIRKYSGNPNWALPYWDYEQASQRALPVPFRTGGPLVVANRGLGWNSGASSLPGWAVDTSGGMGESNFFSAQSQLESIPHDQVHILVSGWMGDVPTAAQDPLFFVHHANIDRLWNIWLAHGNPYSNPLSDSTWKTQTFTFFNENKKQVTLNACQILRAADQLGYTYEGEPTQRKQFCLILPPIVWKYLFRRIWLFREVIVLPRIPRPKPLPIDLASVREQLVRAIRAKNQTVFLRLEGIRAKSSPNVVWQVFVSPREAPLDPEGPFFVGSVGLFSRGLPAHHDARPGSVDLPLDAALARSLDSDELQMTFVPAGPLVRGKPSPAVPRAQVQIRRTSIVIETRTR